MAQYINSDLYFLQEFFMKKNIRYHVKVNWNSVIWQFPAIYHTEGLIFFIIVGVYLLKKFVIDYQWI